MPYLNKKELEARRNGQNPVLATSFVTSHTSTAFTFSMRSIILFSASQRHPAWDICSEKPKERTAREEHFYIRYPQFFSSFSTRSCFRLSKLHGCLLCESGTCVH